jgi:hypothetical protein
MRPSSHGRPATALATVGDFRMDRFLQIVREYPAIAGLGLFAVVSLFLATVLGTAMRQAGVSLKPLVFVFGFFAIVIVPQATVHLLDALAHHRATTPNPATATAPASSANRQSNPAPPPAPELVPVAWDTVFGPEADPALITDPRRGLDAILGSATEAKLAFDAGGGSALAARFASAADARAALDRYGAFFQFAEVSGSDEGGWTARRYAGQGEWNHVVTAGHDLYAWTGPTREAVETRRVRALGPLPAGTTRNLANPAQKPDANDPSRRQVSNRLSRNPPVMVAFLALNLLFAVGWFFKGSAWSARVAPTPGVVPVDSASLRERLLAVNRLDAPVAVTASPDGRTWEIGWRYADARWLDLMRAHRMRRVHKLVLRLDEAGRIARVREFWSAFDASAGRDGLRLDWRAATGMQFFQVEHHRVFGAQLDAGGKPTGATSAAYTFDLQALKAPFIEAVTGGGWTWQPVMLDLPPALRWLTE